MIASTQSQSFATGLPVLDLCHSFTSLERQLLGSQIARLSVGKVVGKPNGSF